METIQINIFNVTYSGEFFILTDECITLNEHRQRLTEYYRNMKFKPKKYYDSEKQENNAIQLFIKYNEFPNWFNNSIYFSYAKRIYENINNAIEIAKIGVEVYNIDNNTNHLRTLFYFMSNCSPLATTSFSISYVRGVLKCSWNGIGNWVN